MDADTTNTFRIGVPVRAVVTLLFDLRTRPLGHTTWPVNLLMLACNDPFATTHATSSMLDLPPFPQQSAIQRLLPLQPPWHTPTQRNTFREVHPNHAQLRIAVPIILPPPLTPLNARAGGREKRTPEYLPTLLLYRGPTTAGMWILAEPVFPFSLSSLIPTLSLS